MSIREWVTAEKMQRKLEKKILILSNIYFLKFWKEIFSKFSEFFPNYPLNFIVLHNSYKIISLKMFLKNFENFPKITIAVKSSQNFPMISPSLSQNSSTQTNFKV